MNLTENYLSRSSSGFNEMHLQKNNRAKPSDNSFHSCGVRAFAQKMNKVRKSLLPFVGGQIGVEDT